MVILEQDKVFYEIQNNGDKVINLPITRVNNVEGIGRSANTAYAAGDVVYVDNNKKVALKCTQAGTTSNSELNVSTASIGNVITDGTVKWQVCNRTSDVTSVNGKTGDVVVGEIVDASINGKAITLTFADGTIKTLTTQDTTYTAGTGLTLNGTEFSLDSQSGGSAYKTPYATSSTAYNTGAKVATITNGVSFVLEAGARVTVKFSGNGYGSPSSYYSQNTIWTTLNVNSTGAKNITTNWCSFGDISVAYIIQSGAVYDFVYDGTYWNMVNVHYYYSPGSDN